MDANNGREKGVLPAQGSKNTLAEITQKGKVTQVETHITRASPRTVKDIKKKSNWGKKTLHPHSAEEREGSGPPNKKGAIGLGKNYAGKGVAEKAEGGGKINVAI